MIDQVGKLQEYRDQFPGRRGHLNTATIGLPSEATLRAMELALETWAGGRTSTHAWDPSVDKARALYAEIVNVPVSNVAVGSHISVFAGLVAGSLRRGQTVLLAEGDFTSLMWPFLMRERDGVTVKLVQLEEIIDAIDQRVDWVAVSSVQSSTGEVLDLAALASVANDNDARVFLDSTQSTGWLPTDASKFAAAACSAYKWLLAPRGTAFLSLQADLWDEITPQTPGWYSGQDVHSSFYGSPLRLAADARRYDLSPAWMLWAGTVPALEPMVELGVDAIHDHDVCLANTFRESVGLPPSNSAIVSLEGSDEIANRVTEAGLHVAERAGNIRLSFHLYNDEEDVARAAACWNPA